MMVGVVEVVELNGMIAPGGAAAAAAAAKNEASKDRATDFPP